MSVSNIFRNVFQSIVIAGLAFGSPLVSAASQCKGMQENACVADGECAWVQSYTRKDGRSVASHCKLKSGKKSEQTASTDAPVLSSSR